MATRFGRFWLHERVGIGGMAEVYRATIGPDPETYSFELAIKRLLPQLQKDPAQVDMFVTEADVAKLLRHPNIVQVYEAGTIEGEAYIAMEYIVGHDLGSLIEGLRKRRLRFPSDLAVYVAMHVLRALDYIHAASSASGEPLEIVHRDVTPSNIYLTSRGEVKLGDFGVARVKFLEGFDEARFLKGKAAYMPPEVLGGAPVTQAVDLWSLSVTLYEMLTARRLFEGQSEEDLMAGRAKLRMVPVRDANPDLSSKLARVVQRALSVRPRRRPREAAELYRELKLHMLGEGISVDGQALARFVADTAGELPGGASARGGAAGTADGFATPSYQVPLNVTPTQRFEIVRRRRRLVGPLVALGVAVVVGAAGYVVFGRAFLARLRGAPAIVVTSSGDAAVDSGAARGASVEPGPASAAASGPAPGSASTQPSGEAPAGDVARARPAVPDEFAIEFSEDLGADADLGLDRGPPRYANLMRKARGFAKHKKYAAADDAFREALALRPKQVPALLGRANALLELRRYQDAEQMARGAILQKPKNARAYLLLGDVLWVQGKDAMARQAYQKCVDLEPLGKPARTAKRILGTL